jgi:CoA:oxalate CoA-transferase
LYGAIATALFERERTGVARRLEVAMQDAVYASLASNLGMQWASQGKEGVPPRTGNRHGGLAEAPYNVYRTQDGYIAIICVGEVHWAALAAIMGKPELATDAKFASLAQRVIHMDEIDAIVSGWTLQSSTDDLFRRMIACRVPCAPVRTLEQVMHDPNLHARGALEWIDHPEFGRIVVQHSPLRFDGSKPRELEPSRKLGADTERVLAEIGT